MENSEVLIRLKTNSKKHMKHHWVGGFGLEEDFWRTCGQNHDTEVNRPQRAAALWGLLSCQCRALGF